MKHSPSSPWLLAALLLVGCEGKDPYGRQPISGTITFQGTVLQSGVIDFLPAMDGQRAGTRAMIEGGKYAVPAEHGLMPGHYRVTITSPETNTTDPPAGPPGMAMPPLGKERIPAKYNTQSRLVVEVTATEKNEFDFAIP